MGKIGDNIARDHALSLSLTSTCLMSSSLINKETVFKDFGQDCVSYLVVTTKHIYYSATTFSM